jgi:hypothetical protein
MTRGSNIRTYAAAAMSALLVLAVIAPFGAWTACASACESGAPAAGACCPISETGGCGGCSHEMSPSSVTHPAVTISSVSPEAPVSLPARQVAVVPRAENLTGIAGAPAAADPLGVLAGTRLRI